MIGGICGFRICKGSALTVFAAILCVSATFILPAKIWQNNRLDILLTVFGLSLVGTIIVLQKKTDGGRSEGEKNETDDLVNHDEFGNSYLWGRGRYTASQYKDNSRQSGQSFQQNSKKAQTKYSNTHKPRHHTGQSKPSGRTEKSASRILTLEDKIRMGHLRTLELDPQKQYSFEQIKRAFRIAAKKHHPDKGGVQEKFLAVYAAWKWFESRQMTEKRLKQK